MAPTQYRCLAMSGVNRYPFRRRDRNTNSGSTGQCFTGIAPAQGSRLKLSPFFIMLIMKNRSSNSTPLCCKRTAKAAAFLVIHRTALTPQGLSELGFPLSMSNIAYILQAPRFERCGGNRQENKLPATSPKVEAAVLTQ
jgi:hypothetical protein